MRTIIRGLIYGLIIVGYMRYFDLPFWPALGLMVLGDLVSVLVRIAIPLAPKPEVKEP
jgi:hypothetical protein